VTKITQPVDQELKLEEFKILYRHWQTGVSWLDHLLLGLLVYLERKFINLRLKNEVDKAIDKYNLVSDELFMDELLGPVYTETPSKTSTSLPEMRLTAPWYVDTVEPPKGR